MKGGNLLLLGFFSISDLEGEKKVSERGTQFMSLSFLIVYINLPHGYLFSVILHLSYCHTWIPEPILSCKWIQLDCKLREGAPVYQEPLPHAGCTQLIPPVYTQGAESESPFCRRLQNMYVCVHACAHTNVHRRHVWQHTEDAQISIPYYWQALFRLCILFFAPSANQWHTFIYSLKSPD